MTDNGIIQSVLVEFPANFYSQVDRLLKTLFGFPDSSEITQGSSALASLENIWIVDDGVISHQQQVGDGSISMVAITSLDYTLNKVMATANLRESSI